MSSPGRIAAHPLALIALLCLVLPGPVGAAQPAAPDAEPMALLMIGNSFAGNAAEYLEEIAEAGGHELVIGLAITAGAPLERHARRARLALDDPSDPESHPYPARYMPGYPSGDPDPGGDGRVGGDDKVSLRDALMYRRWDVVSIQQASYHSFRPETYEPHAGELIALIRETNPEARILVHQTWAYRIDSPRLAKWEMTQGEMHEQLSAAYDALASRHGLEQVPVGDAFAAARATARWAYRVDASFAPDLATPPSLPDQRGSLTVGYSWREDAKTGDRTLRLDAYHAGRAGRYLAGCTWYEVLFGEGADVREASGYTPGGVSDAQAASLRAIAHDTVAAERGSLVER